ncbi:hypothetical protein Tco_0419233 [Tanacetum coccineum]
MLNWSDHEGEDEEKGVAQVYGMFAGDDDDAASDASCDVSDAAAEFALMGLSSQVQAYKNTLQTLEQQKARKSTSIYFVGSDFPAGSRNRPALFSRFLLVVPFSAGWRNHAARPMTRPTSHYFQHFRRHGCRLRYSSNPNHLQVHEASDMSTEEHLRQADMVPAGSIDPAASISAGSIDPAASISAGSAEPFLLFPLLLTLQIPYPHLQDRRTYTGGWGPTILAIQEEDQQFINHKVWKLVPLPDGKIAIGTKWILKNKRDERGICKKQTIVATSSIEAEYVAATNCCGQVLKIHTDENVADVLTKAFDGHRYALTPTHDPSSMTSIGPNSSGHPLLRASKEGPPAILATIDRTPYTITESLVRSQLH